MVTHFATINTTFCHVILHHLKQLYQKHLSNSKKCRKVVKQILLIVKIKIKEYFVFIVFINESII